MNIIAIKMLFGNRAKYIGIVMGLTFASLVITQQTSIFVGLMTRTYGLITDAGLADIWAMDHNVQFIDDITPLQQTQLFRVRGVPGVDWAVPLYKGLLKARLADGKFQTVILIGLDDATLIGGPAQMIEGNLADLRQSNGVIVDVVGARGKLARKPAGPNDQPVPLIVGDVLELNDRRAVVVGIAKVSRTFQSQPVVYTTFSRATEFAPRERKLLSFILVKAQAGQDPLALCQTIRESTGLAAYTREQFKERTVLYFMRNTGIPINFGMTVLLGFIVGTAVAGQTFYNFTLDNLRHFGTLKAMGAANAVILRMIILQSLIAGLVGYGLGVGAASLFGFVFRRTELAFRMPWQLLVVSAAAVLLICMIAALLSILRVIRLEPAMVFKA